MRKSIRWRLPLFLIIAGVVLYAAWPHVTIDHEAQVDVLIELLALQPGMAAGEVGAGEGRMSVILARRLGPSGRVFATELDTAKLKQIRRAGLSNITMVRAADRSSRAARPSISRLRSTLTRGVSACALRSITSRQ